MYNRYIPQSDGTYRRNRIQEPPQEMPIQPPPPEPKAPYCPPEPETPTCANCHHRPTPRPPAPPRPRKQPQNTVGAGSFFRNLLPKDFDTEDLLVVLLLLLMAGDCQEDSNSALLTLVLYLFL